MEENKRFDNECNCQSKEWLEWQDFLSREGEDAREADRKTEELLKRW